MPFRHLTTEESTDEATEETTEEEAEDILNPASHSPQNEQRQETIIAETSQTNESKVEADETDSNSDGLLFSCRCESSRPVITLLSCLRNVALPNSGVHTNGSTGCGPSSSQKNSSTPFTSTDNRGRSKVQYATVLVSEKSLVFQVHGIGRQSRATVDMQSGLFSEFYVSEQSVSILEDEDGRNENGNETLDDSSKKTNREVIKGGEFGINLTTVLECLGVLGPSSLDRTALCLSYDNNSAIFKIELLEEVSAVTAGGGGVVISNCAIPGMSVAEELDVEDLESDSGQGLDYAFRLHPVIARARTKSEFLRDAINELADVSGAISAIVTITRRGLELSTFGHSTECLVVLPYMGNHPEIFISLEGIGHDEVSHTKTYPMHSFLSAMRGLEIAWETCITMNANGMIAIQHQVLDKVGSGQPNYVDFIMGCLEEERDMVTGEEKVVENLVEREEIAFNVLEESSPKREQPLEGLEMTATSKTGDESSCEGEILPTSLFGAVAEIGLASSKVDQLRRKSRQRRSGRNQSTNEDNEKSRKYRAVQTIQDTNETNTLKQYCEKESLMTEDEALLDVTASVSVSFSSKRGRGRKSIDDAPSSPQLMYGDTHLEASEDF